MSEKIDINKALQKLVEAETNFQLNTYSTIHFNKIKNIIIDEY